MARKEKKYHFIYKTTNLLSGKYYIGMHSTDNLDDGYLGSGKRLRYSINKHGKDNHKREIIEYLNSREELKNREEEIVTLNEIAKVDCMNLKVGGEGGFAINADPQLFIDSGIRSGKIHSDKLKNDVNYRTKHIKQALANFKRGHATGKVKYDSFKGKKHSEETKDKMSKAKKGQGVGKTNSQFGTCWVTKGGENKKIKKEGLDQFIKDGWSRGRK